MRSCFSVLFASVILSIFFVSIACAESVAQKHAETPAAIEDKARSAMERADRLLDAGDLDNLKEAIVVYEHVLKTDPDNFEANWKCAKAHREYGEAAKKKKLPAWEDVCAAHGKKGMAYAQNAIAIEPDKPNGYLYYGLNVGIYSDGVGILTALKEGLKDKTQSNFEKAYAIDKTFEDGGSIIALGRFWQVVPWPFNDEDKALALYREFQNTSYYPENVESRIYLAEMLMDQWGRSPKKEARQLLREVLDISDDPYWQDCARQMLADL